MVEKVPPKIAKIILIGWRRSTDLAADRGFSDVYKTYLGTGKGFNYVIGVCPPS